MKKKIILTVLLVLCIVCAIIIGVAYGNNKKEDSGSVTVKDSEEDKSDSSSKNNSEKWEPSLVTINGKEYDLSEDIQKVIGAMVKDGMEVYRLPNFRLYDENGRIIPGSGGYANMNEDYVILAEEINNTNNLLYSYDDLNAFSEKHGYFISKEYIFQPKEGIDFVSGLGVSSTEDVKKLANSETFIETDYGMNGGMNQGYTAVFVNGKPLDYSAYKDKLAELKSAPETTEYPGGILEQFFPHYRAFRFGRFVADLYVSNYTFNELSENYSRHNNCFTLDEELLIFFAMEDAYQQLEAGKAESFVLVSFDLDEYEEFDGMFYNEYYFDVDRTWTPDKFSQVN